MLNWDEYNKDEAAVVQQEAITAKPVVQEAVAEVPEVKEEEPPRLRLLGLAKPRPRRVLELVKVRPLVAIVDRITQVWLKS